MTRWRRTTGEPEKGAVLVTVTIGLITLVAIAALVLDLAAIRSNRAVSQTVADAAATAGALESKGTDGRQGCEVALDYLELNLPSAGSFSGADCLSIPDFCDDSTPAATTTATAGDWIATITYPVRDDSLLLQPSTIGDPAQALHADDGISCDRFGVSIQSTHHHLFGRVLGATSQTSEIHAVARAWQPPGSDFALNLLLLERFDCDVLTASGGGASDGGILVDAVLNPDTGLLDPGFIAVDSDASGACGADGVIDVNGSNGFVRADGPSGCPAEVATHIGPGGNTVGHGCGSIELLSPGTPGCNYPSCTSSGTVAPPPTPRTERVTRAPVDHRYNCKGFYPFPAGWGIDPCNDAPAPHIDNLVARLGGAGTPAGFTSWTSAGYPCNVPGALVVPAGDWHIDCANFRIKEDVIFEGGDVVFDGRVVLTAAGRLAVNSDSTSPPPYTPVNDQSIIYFRGGDLDKAGSSSVIFNQSMVYLTPASEIKMTGGTGIVKWTAPVSGDFDDLAMWAETTGVLAFSGGAGLDLVGVFFAPWATISYSGNGAQVQVAAQFIARYLDVSGNGVLVVRPDFDDAVLFPFDPQSQLIR